MQSLSEPVLIVFDSVYSLQLLDLFRLRIVQKPKELSLINASRPVVVIRSATLVASLVCKISGNEPLQTTFAGVSCLNHVSEAYDGNE
jgi:hypothetical protein